MAASSKGLAFMFMATLTTASAMQLPARDPIKTAEKGTAVVRGFVVDVAPRERRPALGAAIKDLQQITALK